MELERGMNVRVTGREGENHKGLDPRQCGGGGGGRLGQVKMQDSLDRHPTIEVGHETSQEKRWGALLQERWREIFKIVCYFYTRLDLASHSRRRQRHQADKREGSDL